jgi:hypothetical protein
MLYVPPSGSTDANASYVGKNVAAGTQGSKVPPNAVEHPQREILAIIAAAQLAGMPAPTATDLTQMLKATRSGLLNRFVATGSPDAIAIAPQPVYVALVEGMRFRVKVPGSGSNTTTTPTLAINGLSAPIKRRDGSAPAAGDLTAGLVVTLEIDAALNARLPASALSDTTTIVNNILASRSTISASSPQSSVPQGVFTTLSNYATVVNKFGNGTTFNNTTGIITVGANDAGTWLSNVSGEMADSGAVLMLFQIEKMLSSSGTWSPIAWQDSKSASGAFQRATATHIGAWAAGDQLRFRVFTSSNTSSFSFANIVIGFAKQG